MPIAVETNKHTNSNSGFSLVELMMAITIISIMSTVALIYYTTSKKLYKADEQALQLTDLLQEARQKALTQRTTMRVQLDLSDNAARLIDEGANLTSDSDDKLIKTISLTDTSEVKINTRPNNVTDTPTESSPVPEAVFAPTNYVLSPAHTVFTFRFTLTGAVISGTGNVPAGATVYVWKPKTGSTTVSEVTRAITVIGSSGAVRIWNYTPQGGSYVWVDSRRSLY